MESYSEKPKTDWPYLSLSDSFTASKSSKKVFFADHYRNAATLEAVRSGAVSQPKQLGAGFSINTFIKSIPSQIRLNPFYLQDTKRNLEHYDQAPAWRHVKQELEATFYQLAMQREKKARKGELIHVTFTLNLTPELVRKAIHHDKGFLDYIKRRIDKSLLAVLERKPQYWLTVELEPMTGGYTKGKQRPHLHGAILITQSESESIRKQKSKISQAFYKAIGKCSPDFSNRLFQLQSHTSYAQQKGISEMQAAVMWPRYCFKHHAFAKSLLRLKSNLITDNATKSQAKALYELLTEQSGVTTQDKQLRLSGSHKQLFQSHYLLISIPLVLRSTRRYFRRRISPENIRCKQHKLHYNNWRTSLRLQQSQAPPITAVCWRMKLSIQSLGRQSPFKDLKMGRY